MLLDVLRCMAQESRQGFLSQRLQSGPRKPASAQLGKSPGCGHGGVVAGMNNIIFVPDVPWVSRAGKMIRL
jgi:hypothetical protein